MTLSFLDLHHVNPHKVPRRSRFNVWYRMPLRAEDLDNLYLAGVSSPSYEFPTGLNFLL
jgi:hypothetical protein